MGKHIKNERRFWSNSYRVKISVDKEVGTMSQYIDISICESAGEILNPQFRVTPTSEDNGYIRVEIEQEIKNEIEVARKYEVDTEVLDAIEQMPDSFIEEIAEETLLLVEELEKKEDEIIEEENWE